MMKRSIVGTAAAFSTALLIAFASITPAGAQSPPTHRDTAATTPADTEFQTTGMQEFEARRKRGSGWYLTRDQIRKDHDRALGDILVAHFPGIRVVYATNLNSQFLVSTRGEGANALQANQGTSLCYVQVFVDGSFVIDGDISWVSPDNVAGVELYDATRTPPAYRRPNGSCGVLLIWSRT